MVSRKYIKDYKLSESVTERGGIRTESVYVGGDYRLTASQSQVRALRTRILICTVCAWCAFLAALLPETRGSHLLYVALPHAFIALPLFLMSQCVWYLRAGRGPYTHERADKISRELPVRAAFTAGLAGVALIGLLIGLLTGPDKMLPGDLIFALGDAVIAACGVLIFTRRGQLSAKKCG